MWISLGLENYCMKKDVTGNEWTISVTDLIYIWQKKFKQCELLASCKELNPLIEASDQCLIEKMLSLFDNNIRVAKEVEQCNENIVLTLKSYMKNVSLTFSFSILLPKGTPQLLYEELTLPLISISSRLLCNEQTLMTLLREKDAEINEYREQHVVKECPSPSKPFIEKEFREQTKVSSAITNPSSFFDHNVQHLFCHVKRKVDIEEAETAENDRAAVNLKVVKSEPSLANTQQVMLGADVKLEIKRRKVQKHSSLLKKL